MNKLYSTLCLVALFSLSIALSGCATPEGRAGLTGAAIGAGLGAIIGNQSGHAGEGALIGAAAGGLTGLIVQDVRETRARRSIEARPTAQTYQYEPTQGEMLTFEDSNVQPGLVRRGAMADASIQYALLGTGTAGTRVTETRSLKRGREEIAQISSKTYTRNDGTWVSAQQFRISERLSPGIYTMVQTVRTAQSVISGSTEFRVE
jgi:hypothetical protein